MLLRDFDKYLLFANQLNHRSFYQKKIFILFTSFSNEKI